MSSLTVKDLKIMLEKSKVTWQVNSRLKDEDAVPEYPIGGLRDMLITVNKAPKLDLGRLLSQAPSNPFLYNRWIEKGYITNATKIDISKLSGLMSGGSSTSQGQVVDWRSRWGVNWITHIKDQDPCEACWVFGSVGLVESMVRINHAVWSVRSEGDVHDGIGSKCGDCGTPQDALDWIVKNGVADPACYDWPTQRASTYFNPPPNNCGGGSMVSPSYNPTSDRSGRTTRVADNQSYSVLGDFNQQKSWVDNVGPIVCAFDVYMDFFVLGTGVYTRADDPNNTYAGTHIMLIIGYDDTSNPPCWIVKNSWTTSWGDKGFGRIAYGECNIDSYAKIGLQLTNPDPWTKRRLHSGNIIESGNGSMHRNFEMLLPANQGQLAHYWRDNSVNTFPWSLASTFGSGDAAATWPTLTQTTYNRNFETVYLTVNNRLHHWFFDQASGQWLEGPVFGPTDAQGIPGFIQSNYGAPGNFEVVVATSDQRLNHWWRENAPPWIWHDGGKFGQNVAYSGASLIQSNFGKTGNFELVCVLDSGQMQHWWRNNDDPSMPWAATATFGSNVKSHPCMIQGQYGAAKDDSVGNFELCVAVDGMVQHWWRDNSGDMTWRLGATFGDGHITAVGGLLEGSFGFNLELIVERDDGHVQHYWRDPSLNWHAGEVIV